MDLAQYQYLLPRLTGMWTHLERQKGGIGLRGPGETEIETDRRIIRDKISRLKNELTKIDKQKVIQRKNRGKLVRVALVGYTNVGKSTLMNLLSKSDVFAENKLFATLDTTVRKIAIKNVPFLLADTVGFIRKLPHHLVESFKSTLDEVREADVILHVVDISHPQFEDQMKVVNATLAELICRPELGYAALAPIDKERHPLPSAVVEQVEIEIKYEGYIIRQKRQVEQYRKMEKKMIPETLDYDEVPSLRLEARQKLKEFRPVSVGQASRISGVSPADISVLLVYLEHYKATK